MQKPLEKRGDVLVVEMTMAQACAIDIVICECGHRPNNHFDHGDRPCARCGCKVMALVISLPNT